MTDKRKTPVSARVTDTKPKPHLYSIGKTYYLHAHDYLTAKQVERIFTACEKAYNQGTPLNRFITIHYDDYADPKRPQQFITLILERSRKWLEYRGLPVAYLYVLENGKYKGIHAHMLIHIPAHYQREYKKALRRWLPFEWSRTRVNVKTIKYPCYGDISPLDGLYGVLRYMCKGIDPKANLWSIKPIFQGTIFGRRWGVSRSIK